MAGNARILNGAAVVVHNFGDWRRTKFAVCTDLFQCVWSAWCDYLLAVVGHLFGQFGCTC